MLGILCCCFTIPAGAQEGHFGMKHLSFRPIESAQTALNEKAPAEVPLVMPDTPSDFSELRSQGLVLIQNIVDPLRVQLQDGRIVQLAGIDIPDNDPARPGPLASQTFDELKKLLLNKQATLYQTKNEGEGRRNRMGHYLGHLETHDGKFWVQGFLIKNGLARIQPGQDHIEMAASMLALENEAIKHKRGLWAADKFGVLTPETAESAMNGWVIVEGKIAKTGMANNVSFLNFGPDWRKDFTIGIEGEVRRQMAKRGLDTMNLTGKNVRVRGWVESYNGPYIKLSNAIWLEILPDAAPQGNLSADKKNNE